MLVGAVHANYIISKYQKMKKTGRLDKLDQEIERRSRLLDQQQLASAQEQLDRLMLGVYGDIDEDEAGHDGGRSSASGLGQLRELDAQQHLAQASGNKDLWGADGLEDSSSNAGVKKMREELKQMFNDDAAQGQQQDMITPIDELLIREPQQAATEKQSSSLKHLQPLAQSQGASGQVLVQQMLKQLADQDMG